MEINIKKLILSTLKNNLKLHVYFFLVIVLVVVYTSLFSFISIAKNYALNSDVWDLGYAYDTLSSIAYGHLSVNGYITTFFYHGTALTYFPIAYFKSLPLLLFFQSLMLALPIYLLYRISKFYNLSDQKSFLISLCYFFYFPLAGALWFDFHFQILFPVLFLAGYFFFLKESKLLTIIFFLLSGMVRFPYMGLVFLAIFSLVLSDLCNNYKENKVIFRISNNKDRILLLLLIISFVLLLLQYLWITYNNKSLFSVHLTNNSDPLTNFNDKLLTLLILFGFFLFIPLFSLKWSLPLLPFIYLMFFSNNSSYYYPALFSFWYTVSIVPFLFLGFIEFNYKIEMSTTKKKKNVTDSLLNNIETIAGSDFEFYRKVRTKREISIKKNLIYIVVALFVVSSVFYEPYGPLNNNSFNDFNLQSNIEYNMTMYNDALKVINLIPINERFVLVQNDLPQLFVHDLCISNIIVSPYDIGPNVTLNNIRENHFPFSGGSIPSYIKINYVLANLNNEHSLCEPPFQKYYPTMNQILKQLLSSKYYGIKAYCNGILLLERNYNSSPVLFNSSNLSMSLSSFQLHSSSLDNGKINMSFPAEHEVAIYGPFPYLNLLPFNYIVTFNICYSGLSDSKFISHIGFENLSSTPSFIFINSKIFFLENFTSVNSHTFTDNFTTTSYLTNFQMDLYFLSNSGTISINSITITILY